MNIIIAQVVHQTNQVALQKDRHCIHIACAHGRYLVPLSLPQSLLLHPHSRLRWRRVADLPTAMTQHHIVRIGSTIYCGGGYTGGSIDTARLVFQYNPKQDTWSQLPICPTAHFGLTQLDGKLVTVGGKLDRTTNPINDVYVFQDSETWENSIIPPLPTARFYPTAFNYKSTLIASGGITEWHNDTYHSNAVEVFQTKTYQWYHAEPLPVGHSGMSCAIVNDTCYLIGGSKLGTASRHAYCTSVSNLISRALPPDHPETSSTPQASPSQPTWQVLPECPLPYVTAAELGGCLLAIGGMDDSGSPSSAVHMYSPSTNSWVRISSGDLPVPRSFAAATQLEGGEVIFVGGRIEFYSPTKTVFIVSTE